MRAVRLGCVGVLLAVLAGCANQTGERDASSVAARFLAATGRGDTQAACALLTPQTRADLQASDGQSCEEALPADRLRGTVTEATPVDVWSDQAQVNAEGGAVFLTEFDSGWLVSAAGCAPNGDAPYRCVVGG
jgi:hypothetical protein